MITQMENKMKKVLIIIAMLLSVILLAACEGGKAPSTTPNANGGVDAPHTHLFGEWQTVKAATCTEEGESARTCECGEKETKKLDVIEHSYTASVVEPTCTEGGYTSYECVCGKGYKTDKTQKTGHDFNEWVVETPATCQGKGVESSSCKNCDFRSTRESEAVGHSYGEWQTVAAPTCVTNGEEKRDCAFGCGSSESREIAALGGSHVMSEWVDSIAPTCTSNGEKTRRCTRCEYRETSRSSALGHKYGDWVTYTESSCAADGEKRKYCKNCSEYQSLSVPKSDTHTYGAWSVSKEPYCGNAGERVRACVDCGRSQLGFVFPKAKHDFGAWKTNTASTKIRECRICSATEMKRISFSSNATVEAAVEIVNSPYEAGSAAHPYRRQGGCFNGFNAYQALITKNDEIGKIMKKNVITGETTFSEYVPLGHADDVFYLPTTNCIYVGSGSTHYVFDADTLEYKGVQRLGESSGCLYYLPSSNTYVNSSGTTYDANFKRIGSISKQTGETIGQTVQGHCADENYIYELRCQGIGSSKYLTYIRIHTIDGRYVGTVTVKIPENFEPENISVVNGELYIGTCTNQPVATFYKVVFD